MSSRLINDAGWIPISGGTGYEKLSTLSSAQSLTVPSAADRAIIVCEDQDCRWLANGSSPTATDGMPLFATFPEVFIGKDVLDALEIIEQSASAVVHVHYFKPRPYRTDNY